MPNTINRWLLLRGLIREAFHWGDLPNELQKQYGAEQVLCLDLPGVGACNNISSPFSVDNIVANLRQRFLKSDGSKKKHWGVIGQSLGGMIAIAWCHNYPNDFNAAVTINTSASNLAPIFQRFSFKTLPSVCRALISHDPYFREKIILDIASNQPALRKKLLPIWAAHATASPTKRQTFFAQLWAAAFYKIPLRLVTPLLVLTSQADRLVDVRCSRRLAAHFNASILEHNFAGHDLSVDDPQWIIEQIMLYFSATQLAATH
ncbi:MAG: alpha/beta hydrolase [Deltaproteobacteria bacterium]|nr:alpha/beta hydrolase [Deltaproteobacteria bacterium]